MNIIRSGSTNYRLAMLVFALAAVPAFAAQPQTFSDTETQNFASSCSYGDLNWSTTFTAQGSIFLEPTQAATRFQVLFSASTFITNPLNGKIATGKQHSSETLFARNGSAATSGLSQSIKVVGEGTVLQIAGRVVIDSNGNLVLSTPLHDNTDLTPLCNALQ